MSILQIRLPIIITSPHPPPSGYELLNIKHIISHDIRTVLNLVSQQPIVNDKGPKISGLTPAQYERKLTVSNMKYQKFTIRS